MMDILIFLLSYLYYNLYLNIILNSKLYNQINYLLSNLTYIKFFRTYYQMRMSYFIVIIILLYKLVIFN